MMPIRARAVARVAAIVLVTLLVFSGASTAGASPGGVRRCLGAVTVTNPAIARAIATGITVDGRIGCVRGTETIRAFLRKELQPNERCAEAANDPPHRGCRVGPFMCRSSASLLNAKACVDGAERVNFRERDVPLG